ncbi:alpha/beta fold hydrolase [Gangjinia marincola]|uniref:Alpha/beta fold hydrolase n=1 Tax=Gangjinia marincola TaxID=578463 RepID=A0ABP3XSS8_9FLAO
MLKEIYISSFTTHTGFERDITLYYETFGPPLGKAPVVLVNHALTGNSTVTGEKGWWKDLIGTQKCIDTDHFTVLAFNIPGNGYAGKSVDLIENYTDFNLQDMAQLFLLAIDQLNIDSIFAVIGGSIGGALAWHLAVTQPALFEHIIPIATDWKATDWLIAQCKVQEQILLHSDQPVHDARMHAMTFYRTPQSLQQKFRAEKDEKGNFQVGQWLLHHGKMLKDRFELSAYKLMNHLLMTIDATNGSGDIFASAEKIKGRLKMICVNTDGFFLPEENWDTYVLLSEKMDNVHISEIKSIHGHDAFLMEYHQLSAILKPIFQPIHHAEAI